MKPIGLFWAALPLICVTASCVTYYEEPAAGIADAATVSFFKAYDRQKFFMNEVGQDFAVVDDEQCANARRIAFFTGITADSEVRRVTANVPLHFYSETSRHNVGLSDGLGVGVTSVSRCAFMATFTPRPGQNYSVALRMSDFSSCKLEVIEKNSGQAPDDLRVIDDFTCAIPIPYVPHYP